jgi:hypothetical protein
MLHEAPKSSVTQTCASRLQNAAFSATRTRARRSPVKRSSFTTDAAAPDRLQVLSLPPGKSIKDSVGYVYDSSAGKGIRDSATTIHGRAAEV